VIDEKSAAAIDIILAVVFRSERDVRIGEVFTVHPGHHKYEMIIIFAGIL